MSRVIYEELQDKEGNVHYLHTEDKVVFDENGQSLRSAMKEVQFEDYTGAAELPSIETALTGIVRGRKWTDLFGNVKAALKGLATKSEALEGSMGDAFSEGRAYAAGDYAIYKNVLYKFTAAKTAGAWDAAKVRAVTVAEEMCSLNGNLESKISISNIANNLTATASGKVLDARQGKALNDKFSNMFKTVIGNKQYTIDAIGSLPLSIPYTVPSGYKSLGVVSFYTGHPAIFPLRVISGRMDIHNVHNEAVTATAEITILCVKQF